MSDASENFYISIVVPLYNEQEVIPHLISEIHKALGTFCHPWELLLVDDGSTDDTHRKCLESAAIHGEHIRALELQKNFGQTAAMQAGIDNARGNIIVTMDGDLQNDPLDIPRMVQRLLDENLDLLQGWRKNRQDGLFLRKIPSRIANRLIGKITGVTLHDYGCSLKVYRGDVIRGVRLYGEMHRFIAAWVAANTATHRIKEEVVTHHARKYGASKYGISRTFRVLMDLISVYFFMRYISKPGHYFGKVGSVFGITGIAILAYLSFVRLFYSQPIADRPLLLAGVLLFVVGIQLLTTGVLAELLIRTYYEAGNLKPYIVRGAAEKKAISDQGWKFPA